MKIDWILEPTGFFTWAIHSSILDNIKQHYQHNGDTFLSREKMDFWFFVSVFWVFFFLDCRLPWQWYDLLNPLNFSFKCIMFRKPQFFVVAFSELPWISFLFSALDTLTFTCQRSCSQMPVVFCPIVIHGLGFIIC